MDVSEEDSSSASDLSSDEELQVGLAQGTLKPGLIGEVRPRKTFTNNVSGLRVKLAALKRKGQTEWLERMDVTCPTLPRVSSSPGEGDKEGPKEEALDPNDDFKRELWFYQQAQSGVKIGLKKLEELGIATTRPDDYFAEMVKTDDHMRKVRERLLSRQKGLEQREKARKLRELKKFGKKVQQEILKKRRDEKKSSLESVKKFRKGKGERPAFLRDHDANEEEEEFAVAAAAQEEEQRKKKGERRKGLSAGGQSKKRQFKDKKFGFGGKKRGLKSNSAMSSADMRDFNSVRHSRSIAAHNRQGKKGGDSNSRQRKRNQRPGKARRQKIHARST